MFIPTYMGEEIKSNAVFVNRIFNEPSDLFFNCHKQMQKRKCIQSQKHLFQHRGLMRTDQIKVYELVNRIKVQYENVTYSKIKKN